MVEDLFSQTTEACIASLMCSGRTANGPGFQRRCKESICDASVSSSMFFRMILGLMAPENASYPVSFVGLVLPLSIVRWIQFVLQAHQPAPDPNNVHQTVSAISVIIAQTIFALSGVVNVTLLFFTRPGILLLGETPTRSSDTTVFGAFNTTEEGHRAGQSNLRLRPLGSTPEAWGTVAWITVQISTIDPLGDPRSILQCRTPAFVDHLCLYVLFEADTDAKSRDDILATWTKFKPPSPSHYVRDIETMLSLTYRILAEYLTIAVDEFLYAR